MSREKYDKLNPHSFEIPDRNVVLFSGGVDSAATAAVLKHDGKDPLLLFVNTGCDDISESRRRANEIADIMSLELVEDDGMVGFMFNHAIGDNIYIPYRNLLFAIMAAQYGDKIWMGGVKGDFSPDKSPEAFDMFTRTLQNACGPNERVKFVASPFWEMNKIEVAKKLIELEGVEVLRKTLGCYHPRRTIGAGAPSHCGECLACFRRYCLFRALGIDTSGEFTKDPLGSAAAEAYRESLYTGDWHENIPEEVARDIFEERL